MKIKKILITIFVIILLFISIYEIYNIILRKAYPNTYSEYVEKYSKEYGIDKEWIYAIIKAESNFDAKIASKSGAVRTHAINEGNSNRGS